MELIFNLRYCIAVDICEELPQEMTAASVCHMPLVVMTPAEALSLQILQQFAVTAQSNRCDASRNWLQSLNDASTAGSHERFILSLIL